MPFPSRVREDALVKAQRHCCVCHDFAGRLVNVHHIIQECDGGANDLDNAIVLCLRCHAEAGHYNPKHPLGTKYSPSELRRHRDEWYFACANGTARYSTSINVQVKRTLCTSDLHKYVPLFTFRNGNANIVFSWKLEIFLPTSFEVSDGEGYEEMEADFDGVRYRKFRFSHGGAIYLGEERQLTDNDFERLEYNITHELYFAARTEQFKILWRFYSDSAPPIRGELPWEEIQSF